MTFRTEWTVIKHVPNHQPAYLYMALSPQNRCGLQSFQWMRINPMKTSQKKSLRTNHQPTQVSGFDETG